MTGTERYTAEGGKLAPRGDCLKRFFTNRDGKKCLLYILASMGCFSSARSDGDTAARNAAVALLEDIKQQTGLELDVNFVR
jgi:hypothetical protein